MDNKYCNLDGTQPIRSEYTKINDGFSSVEADKKAQDARMQAHVDGAAEKHTANQIAHDPTGKAKLTGSNVQEALDQVETEIIQFVGVNVNAEVGDSHISAAKGKTFTDLRSRLEESEQDVIAHKAENVQYTTTNDANILALQTNKADKADVNTLATAKADTTYVDTLAQSLASGSPKGTYATLVDLQTAFPTGNTNIYVVTADGNWYYWNGSAWAAGGTYQSTGIADDSVSDAKLSSTGIKADVGKIQNIISYDSSAFTLIGRWEIAGGLASSLTDYISTPKIEIANNTEKIVANIQNYEGTPAIILYDSANSVISSTHTIAKYSVETVEIEVPSTAKYFVVSAFKNGVQSADITKYSIDLKIINTAKVFKGLIDSQSTSIGQIQSDVTKLKAVKPKAVILDTDWGGDIDDASAVAILAWAERSGLVDIVAIATDRLRGTTISGTTYDPVQGIDAELSYYGINDMCIAANTDSSLGGIGTGESYISTAAQFPHTYNAYTETEQPVNMYRRALVSLPDGEKCDIIVIGYVVNISDLLDSAADSISSLNGVDLVEAKVNKIWIMGGMYPQSTRHECNLSGASTAEPTIINASDNIFNNCPVPIVFVGAESAITNIHVGDVMYDQAPSYDILYQMMYTFFNAYATSHSVSLETAWKGQNFAWDTITTLLCCFDDLTKAGFNTVRGTNTIDTDSGSPTYGYNTFLTNPSGNHYYVVPRQSTGYYKHLLDSIIINNAWSMRPIGRVRLIRYLESKIATGTPNLVANGDFSNGTTGWTPSNITGFTVNNNEASFTATAQYGLIKEGITLVPNHKYYMSAYVKAASSSVALDIDYVAGTMLMRTYHSGSGKYERLSAIATAPASGINTPLICVQDRRTSGWNAINVQQVVALDLTATFGAGNEPSQAWCDANL